MANNGAAVDEHTTLHEAEALVTRCRHLSQRVATYIQRVVGEGEALGDELKMLLADIKRSDKNAEDPAVEDKLSFAKSLLHGHGPGGDVTKLVRQKQPSLLAWMLGSCVNVVTLQRKEAHGLKEEYHAFRDKGAMVLVLFSSVLNGALWRASYIDQLEGKKSGINEYSFTPPTMVGVQCFLAWLLYFYTGMALRENVLKVNGSNIKQWWIHHHYWAMVTTLVIITLPVDSPAVQMFVRRLLTWSILQGCVMLLQNRYQRRRMYTRIALGKNRSMDVVGGEASGSSGNLFFLYPLLIALQFLQIAIGGQMFVQTVRAFYSPEGWLEMEAHESDLRGSRGVALAGLLMMFMGLTNMYHTLMTLIEKRGRKSRKPSARRRDPPAVTPTGNAPPLAATPDGVDPAVPDGPSATHNPEEPKPTANGTGPAEAAQTPAGPSGAPTVADGPSVPGASAPAAASPMPATPGQGKDAGAAADSTPASKVGST